MDFATMLQALFGQGGGANAALGGVGGGGAVPPIPPTPGGFGGSPVPYGAETAALPASVGPAPQDQGPTMGGPGDTMTQLTGALGGNPSPSAPMMGGGNPVPFQGGPQSFGASLEPTGVPIPGARPPGLGLGTAGGTGPGSPGNYGGSPETNPNLKPIGTPAAKAPPPDLAKILGGIKPPARPDVVKPSTPAAPHMTAPGNSQLISLLTQLMGGQGRGLRMPTTLGQALELKPGTWGVSMASPQDYFTPGTMPAAQPDQNIMPQIASFMNDPKALTALLAFGTAAMQPQWGGPAVNFGQGVGAAGEALSKQEEDQRKQQEIDSKAQLREAQAGAAEARANTASTRSSLTGLVEQGKTERNLTLAKLRLANMHQNYINNVSRDNAAIRKANDAARFLDPKAALTPEKPVLPFDEWARSNPMIQNLGLSPAGVPPSSAEGGDSGALPEGATLDTASTGGPTKQPGMTQVVKRGQYAGKEVQWDGTKWNLTGR